MPAYPAHACPSGAVITGNTGIVIKVRVLEFYGSLQAVFKGFFRVRVGGYREKRKRGCMGKIEGFQRVCRSMFG